MSRITTLTELTAYINTLLLCSKKDLVITEEEASWAVAGIIANLLDKAEVADQVYYGAPALDVEDWLRDMYMQVEDLHGNNLVSYLENGGRMNDLLDMHLRTFYFVEQELNS